MIVISAALVLVALVLLLVGLVSPELGFVYASMAVSVLSFAFLIGGVVVRGKDESTEEGAPSGDVSDVSVGLGAVARSGDRLRGADEATVSDGVSGTVLVVAGRPRYHVEGCRYLTGKESSEVEVTAARAEGFTACGVCKPDAVLEALTAEPVAEIVLVGEQTVEEDTGVPGTEDAVEQVPARARGSRRVAEAEPAAAPAGRAPAKRAARKAPAPVAVAPTAEPAAAPKAKRPGRVVVIPDRGRFHTADCRFVRGVAGTEELTRTQASRGGYQPCGVCKPS